MCMELKKIDKRGMGARIQSRRKALGISQKELGIRACVTGKTISNIESGSKGMSMETLYNIKQILGVSIDFLLEGDAQDLSGEGKRKQINENILGPLSVCSVYQLGFMEQVARAYAESIVKKE